MGLLKNLKKPKAFIPLAVIALSLIGLAGYHNAQSKKAAQLAAVKQQSEVNKVATFQAPVKKFKDTTGKKIAYLTFDDGPTPGSTEKILDTLKQNNIHATFFMIGYMAEKSPDLVKQVAQSGNKIALHTYSHDYKKIYHTPDGLMNDIHQEETVLKNILGNDFSTKVFRFPAGSFGKAKKPYRDEVTKDGYTYVDWNALVGDGEARVPSEELIMKRLKETVIGQEKVVLLMHDSPNKQATVKKLPEIISFLKEKGYDFDTIADGDKL